MLTRGIFTEKFIVVKRETRIDIRNVILFYCICIFILRFIYQLSCISTDSTNKIIMNLIYNSISLFNLFSFSSTVFDNHSWDPGVFEQFV